MLNRDDTITWYWIHRLPSSTMMYGKEKDAENDLAGILQLLILMYPLLLTSLYHRPNHWSGLHFIFCKTTPEIPRNWYSSPIPPHRQRSILRGIWPRCSLCCTTYISHQLSHQVPWRRRADYWPPQCFPQNQRRPDVAQRSADSQTTTRRNMGSGAWSG